MKRLISILLAVMLVASCAVVASAYGWNDPDIKTVDEAVAEHVELMGEEVATNRYYFLMPNGKNGELGDDDSVDEVTGEPIGHAGEFAPTWFVPMSETTVATGTAGIYWWGSGVADPAAWVGYLPSGSEESDPYVFYADVPQAATTIIWNNAVDGGMDSTQPIYFCAAQSINIPCEYYEPGESENYPDGTESFDNMIFVVDPDLISVAEFSGRQTCGGEWYYYYGNGCYGFTPDGTEADCLRDDHYDAEGNHVIPEHDPIPPVEPPSSESTAPEYLLGDVDGDGVVSVMDATEIQMVLAQTKEYATETSELAADVDKDGQVSIMDATEIQMIQAGLK
ncbi:MAG: dockerin type I repeat-containing protein [Ruminococcus sp.]|nr:dockerin type I repeat-containing protein [Ruminococcus sp.]